MNVDRVHGVQLGVFYAAIKYLACGQETVTPTYAETEEAFIRLSPWGNVFGKLMNLRLDLIDMGVLSITKDERGRVTYSFPGDGLGRTPLEGWPP